MVVHLPVYSMVQHFAGFFAVRIGRRACGDPDFPCGGDMKNRKERAGGFTLIELLITVAIIGILAAIAIPRLFLALQAAKQKRSMEDIHTVAVAVEIYCNDEGRYPVSTDANTEDIEPLLIDRVPHIDGWGNAIIYRSVDGLNYTIISFGRGGHPNEPYSVGPIRRYQDDLVFSNGVFTQWPEGYQGS